jgi:hypothetical protein
MVMSAANCSASSAIVIVANSQGIGRVESTGYAPRCIVAAGARRRARLLDSGIVLSWAFVEAGSMEIKAEHEIGCRELMDKLDALTMQRFVGSVCAAAGPQNNLIGSYPYIREVYPLESHYIFGFRGQTYRQTYALDPIERIVGLSGDPVKVDQKVSAAAFIPRNQTGAQFAYAPAASATSFTTGGKDSELITQIVRNWTNITQAAQDYVDYTKTSQSKPMRPAFYPVSLSDDGKVIAQLNERGPGVFDFAVWSAGEQEDESGTKSHGGDRVPMSEHAFVGNPADKSTWHLPIDTPGRAKNALARINQTHGIPASKKVGVLKKVQRAAKKFGTDVSETTPGQKKWTGRKVAAEVF